MGQENAAKGLNGATSFNDVAAEHWASGYINWAAGAGIVKGKGEGIFDPDAPVKYEEAIKMLVAALGYEPLATRKGGYPTGYLTVAATNGMTKNVNLAGNKNAIRQDIAKLVYNSLDIPLMDANVYSLNGNDEYIIYDGTDVDRKTILSEYLDITKIKAEIVETAITNSNLVKKDGNQIKIKLIDTYKFDWENIFDGIYEKNDTMTLYEGNSKAASYIGSDIVAYTKAKDNDYIILSAIGDNRSVETLEISKDIKDIEVDWNTKKFEYYKNENDLRPTDVDFENTVNVYVNGVEVSNAEDWFNNIPEKASSVVLMANKGEDYSKVFITSYIYALVEDIDLDDEIIYTDKGDLELGDTREKYFTYDLTLDGNKIEIEDLEENDVLNILCDPKAEEDFNDKDIVKMDIFVTRNTVSGMIEEYLGDNTYVIDGKEYIDFDSNCNPDVGDVARFFLTIDGKLFATDTDWEGEEGVTGNYGFITAVGETVSFGETTYEIKMFTMDGSIETFVIAEKVKINGTKDAKQSEWFAAGGKIYDAVKGPDSAETAITSIPERFIKYKLNSNDEIKEINFVSQTFEKDVKYKESTEKFAGKLINNKSVLLLAEPESDGSFEESKLEILSFYGLDEDEVYNTYLFDVEDNEIGVAVITNGIVANKKSALAIVTGTSTVTDDKMKINFYQNGEFKSYVVNEDCDDLAGIKKGDIFQYTVSEDEIVRGTIVYNKDGLASGLNTATVKYVVGNVTDKETKYITVDGIDYSFAKNDIGTIAVYNTERDGKNAITELSSFSGLKKTGTTYEYKVVLRIEDDEIVDAIEYQTKVLEPSASPEV